MLFRTTHKAPSMAIFFKSLLLVVII
ncbi:hypothetical protein M8C21_023360 [Ambrosia artemisiifolia]|uniref:Uncharacterized protein n=1 Tax=Ambrosia artemisiifolia TaxID=4212 RepID=A0AAD5GK80_AMBAR|nr:hypothetical protein M8C21_023360 [Ambrosia artemisiifolia]